MSRAATTLPAKYFEALYSADGDPWNFATSAYECEKYAATIASLPAGRYGRALEVGCSIGVLTRLLAERCDVLLAVDGSTTALAAARHRCRDLQSVAFENMMAPQAFPDGRFDLIVLSEVLYYLDRGDLDRLAGRCIDALAPAGDMVLVHWTGPTDYPLGGDDAAEAFIAAMPPTVRVRSRSRHPRYRLDVLHRTADPA